MPNGNTVAQPVEFWIPICVDIREPFHPSATLAAAEAFCASCHCREDCTREDKTPVVYRKN